MERLRYFFEAGVVGTALWPDDVESPYGYPAELELLPISAALAAEVDELSEWFQSVIDWDDPGGPSPWSQDEEDRFYARALPRWPRCARSSARAGRWWTGCDRSTEPRSSALIGLRGRLPSSSGSSLSRAADGRRIVGGGR